MRPTFNRRAQRTTEAQAVQTNSRSEASRSKSARTNNNGGVLLFNYPQDTFRASRLEWIRPHIKAGFLMLLGGGMNAGRRLEDRAR